MTASLPETITPDLLDHVRTRIARQGLGNGPEAVASAMRSHYGLVSAGMVLKVVEQLHRESLDAGPLQVFLDRDDVTDVLVNGDLAVWVDSGAGLREHPSVFASDAEVRRLAQRLASIAGRRLDDACGWVDGRLPDGTRLHAILAPLARPGTLISLRKPSQRAPRLSELEHSGSLSPTMARALRQVVATRKAFLVTGATGSGKTTMLSALLSIVDPNERIVIVEDSAELAPNHPHVVSLEGRPANVEGAGLVTMRDLIRQSLRMRPDRLIVGEVRGAEVADMLAAMNTGHEGGAATLHANSPRDVPARLAALGSAAGMARETTWLQAEAAIDRIVHVGRDASGQRRVLELARLERNAMGELAATTIIRHED